jgi:hypothetical protein
VREELANPSPYTQEDASFDEALLAAMPGRCTGCGGKGWKERRHKPTGRVICRVCQGYGSIRLDPFSGKIKPLWPSKVYWHRRPWRYEWD